MGAVSIPWLGSVTEGYARAEPLLGNPPGHVGFRLIECNTKPGWSRYFSDLLSVELFCENPRLESLGGGLTECHTERYAPQWSAFRQPAGPVGQLKE